MLVATVLLVAGGCSHAAPATATTKVERRDDWLLALTSDLERIAASDGFEGRVRVLHSGKAEVDRTFGDAACLPVGAGRRLLATVAVAVLVEEGKLGWDDWLERRLPGVKGTSFAALTVENLLTDSAGLAPTTGETVEQRLDAAGRIPLWAQPGTRIDPGDERPWVLVERVVAQVSGEPFERFVERRIVGPAGMSGTSLDANARCPEAGRGTTTLEDQFRLIDALRSGKVVSPRTRAALWEPRLPLGPGSEVAYGFLVRTRGDQQAVGMSGEGTATAYDLWLDPVGTDALVLLGRTQAKTARGIRTALGEFYALPPGPPHQSSPAKRPSSR
ncbi:MAG TPA: serine hydrolase domain-containing protein [Myxococcaceae bacterium]|nr:serine hydrolase domain-containing protein [Myxococcaceae bacterium]